MGWPPTPFFQDIRAKPATAAVAANPVAEPQANPGATALVVQGGPELAGESTAVLTAPAALENTGPSVTSMPSRRDGWLSPIELNERAEPLTTATPAPRVVSAATKRVGSSRPRRASNRGLLPITLQSYLELLDWTGRQLRAGTRGVIPQGLESIIDRLKVSAESWLETVAQFCRRFRRAVGLADHLKAEAQRLGVNWLQGVRSSKLAFAYSPCP